MLGAVLVWLIINGRKEEMRQTAAQSEVVQTARLSATRVAGAGDLEIAEADVVGMRKGEGAVTLTPITIRNRGNLPSHNILLRLQCLDAGGKVIDTRTWRVDETIPPGQSITTPEIALDKVPRTGVRYRIAIIYSDLGSAPESGREPAEATKGGKTQR
jgi:hypothetical protein